MSLAKNFKLYKDEIELVCEQNRVECDLYSIIAHIIRESKQREKVSLRDVSVRRGTEFSKTFRGNSGFPDFVVRTREKSNSAKVLGAIEVKYVTENLDSEDHLEQLGGHIAFYKKVLYTNGLEWRYYNSKKPENNWKIILGKIIVNTIVWEEESQWKHLLNNLNGIEWIE